MYTNKYFAGTASAAPRKDLAEATRMLGLLDISCQCVIAYQFYIESQNIMNQYYSK